MRLFSIVILFILLTAQHNKVWAELSNPDGSQVCTDLMTGDRTCLITKETLCPIGPGLTLPAGEDVSACIQEELFNWDVTNDQSFVTKKLRFELAANIDGNSEAIPYNMKEPVFLFNRRNIEIVGTNRNQVSISPDDDWQVSLGLDHYSMINIVDSSNILIEGINFDGYSKNIYRDDLVPGSLYQTTAAYHGVDGIRICATNQQQVKGVTVRRISSEHITRWFLTAGSIYSDYLWDTGVNIRFGGLRINNNNNATADVFRLQQSFVDHVNTMTMSNGIRMGLNGKKFGCLGKIHNVIFEENDLELLGNAIYLYPPSILFTENDINVTPETWREIADDFTSRYTGFIIRNNYFRVWDPITSEPAELPLGTVTQFSQPVGHALSYFHSFIKVHYSRGMVIEGNRFDASKADPDKTRRRIANGELRRFYLFSNGAMLNLAAGMQDTIVRGNFFKFPETWPDSKKRFGIGLKDSYSPHNLYGLGQDRVFGITRGTVITGNHFVNTRTTISDATANNSQMGPYHSYDISDSSLWIDEYPIFEANNFNGQGQGALLYENYLERQSDSENKGFPEYLIREYPTDTSGLWDQKIIALNGKSPVVDWVGFGDLASFDATQLSGNFNGDANGVMDLCISRFTLNNGWRLYCAMGRSNSRDYGSITIDDVGSGDWITQDLQPIVIDFNADGRDDLCTVQVLPGGINWETRCVPSHGNGTFGEIQQSTHGALDFYSNNVEILVGGIDSIPGKDICISDLTTTDGWQISCVGSLGNGLFTLATRTSIPGSIFSNKELIPGDYNDDGYLDLCAIELTDTAVQSNCVWGDGSRGFLKLITDNLAEIDNGNVSGNWNQFNDIHDDTFQDTSMAWSAGSITIAPARNYVGDAADDICLSRQDEHGWILYCAESMNSGQFNSLPPHHYTGSNWQDLKLTILGGNFSDDNYADICAVQTHQLLGVRPFCAASAGNGSFAGLVGKFRSVQLNTAFAVGKTSIGNKERLVLSSLTANDWFVMDLGDLFQ